MNREQRMKELHLVITSSTDYEVILAAARELGAYEAEQCHIDIESYAMGRIAAALADANEKAIGSLECAWDEASINECLRRLNQAC